MDKDYVKVDAPSAMSASMGDDEYLKVRRSTRENSKSVISGRGDDEGAFTIAVIEREDNLRYGWGRFTPACLQRFCTPRFLLFLLMMIAMAQGFFVHGILPSSYMSLHEQFGFDMVIVSVIRIMYDIGLIAGFFPVIYMEFKGAKRPYVLGFSCILMSIGAGICALPHVFSSNHNPNWAMQNETFSCAKSMLSITSQSTMNFTADTELNISSIANGDTSTSMIDQTTMNPSTPKPNGPETTPVDTSIFKYFFMMGVFLNGFGAAFYFTMGISFLDENVCHRTSVLYTGALSSALIFGVGLGFSVNALVLKYVFINPTVSLPDFVDSHHHGWIGAWWIGMLASAVLSALPVFPMFGFPRELPGATKAHIQDVAGFENTIQQKDVTQGILNSIRNCLRDRTYVGLVLEQITQLAIVSSFTTVLPLYLRMVFEVKQWFSNVMTGIVVVFALGGSAFGTFYQHYFNLTHLGNLRFALATSMSSIVFLTGFFVGCYHYELAGWTEQFPVHDSSLSPKLDGTDVCNMNCFCNANDYDPYCYRGPNRTMKTEQKVFIYQSPCHAGCYKNGSDWINCACAPIDGKRLNFTGGGSIKKEKCKPRKCYFRAAATTLLFCWSAMFMFARQNPMEHCLLRCIPMKDRLVGLILSAVLSRLIGAIPSPLAIGAVLKAACRGTLPNKRCVFRDKYTISVGVGILSLVVFMLNAFGLGLATFAQEQQYKKEHNVPQDPSSRGKNSPAAKGKAGKMGKSKS